MALGYTCGSCTGAADGVPTGGHSGQDLFGIYDPGPLSVGEALAASGYYEPLPFAPATATEAAPATGFSGGLALAALAVGAIFLLASE